MQGFFGKYIEEAMLLPVLENAMEMKYSIIFKFKKNSRNHSIKNFISKIKANNHILNLKKIITLRNEILELPIEIIDKRINLK